jgi:hypothetical protein
MKYHQANESPGAWREEGIILTWREVNTRDSSRDRHWPTKNRGAWNTEYGPQLTAIGAISEAQNRCLNRLSRIARISRSRLRCWTFKDLSLSLGRRHL